MRLIKLVFFFIVIISGSLLSHPVIWKGGTEYILTSSEHGYDFTALYSFGRSSAAGVRLIEDSHRSTGYFQYNHRLFRFNKFKEQENFYTLFGVGFRQYDPLFHIGFQLDWETQRNFSLIAVDHYSDYGMEGRFRYGIAPYIGEFDDIHTWVMLEYRFFSYDYERNVIIPILRFFKSSYLIELGIGKDYFITIMLHL